LYVSPQRCRPSPPIAFTSLPPFVDRKQECRCWHPQLKLTPSEPEFLPVQASHITKEVSATPPPPPNTPPPPPPPWGLLPAVLTFRAESRMRTEPPHYFSFDLLSAPFFRKFVVTTVPLVYVTIFLPGSSLKFLTSALLPRLIQLKVSP